MVLNFYKKKKNKFYIFYFILDALTVSETSIEPPTTETTGINNANDLATEALFINQNFRRQVLKLNGPHYKLEHDRAPFEDDSSDTKVECGYKYLIMFALCFFNLILDIVLGH